MTPAIRSLLRAAADGDASLVRALLAQGTDVNAKTAAGQTPLMLAAAFGHASVVSVLLAAGADTDLQDELGLSAREWSAKDIDISRLINGRPATPIEEIETTKAPDEVTAQDKQTAAAAPSRSNLVANESSAAVETVENVLFQKRRLSSFSPDAFQGGLGGLAGAILRERAAKPLNDDNVSDDFPDSESTHKSSSLLTDKVEDQSPHIPSSISSGRYGGTSPVETDPIEELNTTSVENPRAQRHQARKEELDENTFPGKRSHHDDAEVVDTVSPGRTLIPRKIVLHEDEPSLPTARVSKVQVPVPSFGTASDTGWGRPIKWVLVIMFLAAGAAAGYFLSDYVLKKNASSTPSTQQVTQPTKPAPKSGPTVGGNLEGAEVLLPDAEYPNGADLSGKVTVAIQVDERGTVISTKALDGDERLQRAAVAAASKATFSPEKLQGKGRVVSGTLTYEFTAPNQTASTHQSSPSASPAVSPATQPSPALATVSNPNSSPTVSGALAGSELRLPQPEYPAKLKSQGVAGTVVIVVRVNRTGRVVSWRTDEGDAKLRKYALEAAKKATFSPDKLPGKGDVLGTLTYTFK